MMNMGKTTAMRLRSGLKTALKIRTSPNPNIMPRTTLMKMIRFRILLGVSFAIRVLLAAV
jgi:hypothetical protein